MLLSFFTSLALAFSMSLLLASTPLLLGAWILLLTFAIATIFFSSISSWLAMFTLLIYIGGLLVMFAYFIALAPNQIFEVKTMVLSSIFIISFFSFIFIIMKPSFPFSFFTAPSSLPITSLLSSSNMFILVILALILFLTLVAVVKISSFSSGPLRPWKFLQYCFLTYLFLSSGNMANWGQLAFQDAASPLMSQLIFFHDHAMAVIVLIMTLVTYALISLMFSTLTNRYSFEAQTIETVWTVLPAFILLFLALPSLRLLYLLDEISSPSLTLKTVGHQWYWSYEYSDFSDLEFDSYMLPSDDLNPGQFRLLEVDNRAILPMFTETRVLITAADVIHSWTVPSLGVKADAIPGRLNQIGFTITRPGVFYGQCSEICGANHSFMPIVIESVDSETFINWLTSQQ